jgi:hypothetical protein
MKFRKFVRDVLWERHKNPLSWFARPVFGAGFCYGFYIHSWLWIGLSIFALATSWFWFPKPKKPPAWTERFLDKELEYIKKPFGPWKTFELLLTATLMITTALAFWYHNLLLGLIVFGMGILYKLIWSIALAKRQAWFIVVMCAASLLVIIAIVVYLLLL